MTRDEYVERRKRIDFTERSIGVFGIELYEPEALDEGQEGYAGDDWPESWLVIAHDTGMGDPIILELDSPEGRVVTAAHGEGSWEPEPIAGSLDAFAAILTAFSQLAEGRDTVDAADDNPISKDEHDRFVAAVREADPDLDPEWWISLVYAGEEPPAA